MIVISTAKMGHGTFQAKFIPLSKLRSVEKIYVLRKKKGPEISKVEYIVLHDIFKYAIINLLFTPFILCYYTLKLKADLILAYHLVPHAFFASFASFVTRRPYVFCQTGGESQVLAKKTFVGYLIKKVLSRAEKINVPGVQALSFWKSYGLSDSKLSVLHSTINTEVFKPSSDILDIDVLYVGILNKRKRVDQIIIAFNSILEKQPNAILGIVGDGPNSKELNDLVTKLGISKNVVFFGFQEDVKQYLSRSKIFTMFSTMEGLPVALMEAMSCEKLVVAPAVDNIPSVLINKETGFLLTENSIEELQSKLLYAYENYDNLYLLRKQARQKIIQDYSYKSALEKWQKILSDIKQKY